MNILSLPIGRDGCSGYRVKNPLDAIERGDNEHQVYYVSHTDAGEQVLDLIQGANTIVFRQQHEKMFTYLKEQKEIDIKSKLLVVDIDDDIFNITPFADTYRWGGVEEVEYEGKKLWENGVNNFDAERNKDNLENIVTMLGQADLITCTTEYLKERIIAISGNTNIEVLPNAIDFRHWKKWDLKKHKEIRIGWTGGATHYIDWYTIKDGLQEVFKKYDNLKLVLQGCKWNGTIKDLPYEYYDWIDFEGHPYKSASMDFDIAIIPLKDTLFNKSKSCIKWYEFSALGIPSLVSNVSPYKEEITSQTALKFNNTEEFVEQLSKLIESTQLRRKIGLNAQKWVKKNRDLEKIKEIYIKVYEKNLKTKQKEMQVENYVPITFTNVETVKEPEQHLKKIDSILKKLGVKYYLGFGTALGFYRDKDFIPQDTDIDFCLLNGDPAEILEEVLKAGYTLIRKVKDDKIHQLAFWGEDKFILDLCFFYKEGDEWFTKAGVGMFRDKIDIIGEPQDLDTKYGSFPIPEKIEDYLEVRYGDWKTPLLGAHGKSVKV